MNKFAAKSAVVLTSASLMLAGVPLAGAQTTGIPDGDQHEVNANTKILPVVKGATADSTSDVTKRPWSDVENPLVHLNGQDNADYGIRCVVDQPRYNIGYTGWLDMQEVVRAWNVLREQGMERAVSYSERISLTGVNYYLTSRGQAPIVWNGTDAAKASAQTSLDWIVANPQFAAAAGPAAVLIQRMIAEPEFKDSFLSKEDNYNYWLDHFMDLAVASDFEISFKVDPNVVTVDEQKVKDIDAWIAAYQEANYNTGNAGQKAFAEVMRPYEAVYLKDGGTLKDGTPAEAGTIVIKFRVKQNASEAGYESQADYEQWVNFAQNLGVPVENPDTRAEVREHYQASVTGGQTGAGRDVLAEKLDLAYNGDDHKKTYNDPNTWQDPVNKSDELVELSITTPEGLLTVTEENYRMVDGLDPLNSRKFMGSNPRVIGDFRLPFSDDADVQATMAQRWDSTWNIQFNQKTPNPVTYETRTDVTIDHRYVAVDAQGEPLDRVLPEEVLATLPTRLQDQSLDAAKAYAPSARPAVGTKVETSEGTWEFKGWNDGTPVQWTTYGEVGAAGDNSNDPNYNTHEAYVLNEVEPISGGVTDCKYRYFEGTWQFTPDPSLPIIPIPVPIPAPGTPAQPVQTQPVQQPAKGVAKGQQATKGVQAQNRQLASTGASVVGLLAAAALLIAGGVYLVRKRRNS
ncbi:SHIRT domain-containing protein [Corynebacterium sp. 153RC1]|uniref:SHIRT domain-containing protein n=1 Tax=unclassified Corynebacterium TaxID=2624378 RepID=UPI00211C95D2|nr:MULTISPECIES: SHIRT domain-containing protein [unclassified Corynebacterium]MCQ9353147.1 SHIRT domain-containing protein [Corynebacterium sp. 209RC1]MCQ9355351.1 SHIRT domain-containing protein [Corynebacterium sp. 1222RC1]MCQ9357792.1 SHIRT domain-containing protein [Corynebacterium sp. 122RC1]MCQ9359181.1 SHIRT domain-containing protein [Corynebacterium sp. 142RC1]MCQ9361885.1 SHIRT domain-containing protein [Corynebacterium sp. 153RC1]